MVNTEKVEKGQSIMDALLGMFKVSADTKKGNLLLFYFSKL